MHEIIKAKADELAELFAIRNYSILNEFKALLCLTETPEAEAAHHNQSEQRSAKRE